MTAEGLAVGGVTTIELRSATRRMLRHPAFLLLTVGVLSVAIGGNTAVFSVAYGVLGRPLPYPRAEELVQLWPDTLVDKLIAHRSQEVAQLSAVAPYLAVRAALGESQPELVAGARVGVDYFRVLQARPLLGRTFGPEDGVAGAPPTVVLGHDLWSTRFGGDETLVGRTILVDGTPHTVLGVLADDHRPLRPEWQLWLPLTIAPDDANDYLSSFYLNLIGRLAPGATVGETGEALHALALQLQETYPNLITEETVAAAGAMSLHEYRTSASRPTLLLLVAAVGLVLLIACANVANLMHAQALHRRREIAVRSAMGGAPRQIVQHMLTESMLLGLAGGVGGVLIAWVLVGIVPRWLPDDVLGGTTILIDARVLAFNFAISLAAASLSSLVPARWAVRLGQSGVLQSPAATGGGTDRRSRHSGRVLVALQVATATLLLIGGGMVLRSLWQLHAVDPGFATEGLVSVRLDLPEAQYREPERMVDFYQRAIERIAHHPQVSAVGGIHLLPLSADNWSFPYVAEDRPVAAEGDGWTTLPSADFRVITPDYFATAGLRLLAGRGPRDAELSEVGWIDRTFAEAQWGVEEAVGRKVELFGPGGPSFTVAGVVEAVRQHRLDAPPQPTMYRLHRQWPVASMYLMIRSNLPSEALVPALRQAVWEIDRRVPISDVVSVRDVVRRATTDERVAAQLLLAFALLALSLALVGLTGVVRLSVAQRTREMGIRMAIGAGRNDLFRRVVGEGMALAVAGLVIGLGAGVFVGHLLAPKLFGISPLDGLTYVSVIAFVVVAAVVSVTWPARWVHRISPMAAIIQD